MLTVAYLDVQKGVLAVKADLIPAAQLLNGTIGSSSSTTTAIAYHLDTVSGVGYLPAPYTTPLRLDGVTFPWQAPSLPQAYSLISRST